MVVMAPGILLVLHYEIFTPNHIVFIAVFVSQALFEPD